MKKFFSLALISILTLSAFATDYTVEPTTAIKSNTLPIFLNSTSYYSITQQIFLPSEFSPSGATEGNITAITFYYGAKAGGDYTAQALTRNIRIFLMQVPSSGASKVDSYTIEAHTVGAATDYVSKFLCDKDNNAGEEVFNNSFTTEEVTTAEGEKPLTLNITPYHWDGSSNIVMTVIDMSSTTIPSDANNNLKFFITKTDNPRFAHYRWPNASASDRNNWIADGGMANRWCDRYPASASKNNTADQAAGRSYVPKTTFTIATAIPAPENLEADPVGTTTATLNWDEVTGATAYNVRWGKTSGSLDHSQSGVTDNFLAISDLEDDVTYYFDVQTITATGTSAYADAVSFHTAAITHTHNDITFSKWASTTSMPTSGNYYLANDVTYDFYEGGYLDLAGDLNLCLNGHTINLGIKSINVTNGHTMTLFDHVGGGKITGLVAGDVGALTFKGVISVENGGTLVLREGEVENTKPADDPEYKSLAIASGGTLIISGAPVISGNDIDIFLAPTTPAKVITIESGKPLTNSTPYKVYKMDGVITSGWENMSGADPADYFVSANPDKSIYYNGSEAALISILNLTDNADNSSQISENHNQVRYVATNRSFTAGMYNTICMPFALSSAQIESVFGAGTDVQELSSSTYDGEYIDMYFSAVSAMAANTPYLINPANNVANAAFNGVTIVYAATPVVVNTSYVDLTGITSITALTASEDRYLLGANNKLGYLEADGNLKGMRAYFDTHNLGGGAAPAKRLRIAPDQSMPSALDEATTDKQVRKHMENGQLIIIRDGKRYNALGAEL